MAESETATLDGTVSDESNWVHNLLGGGKAADIFMWRKEKKVSAAVLGLATLAWYYVYILDVEFVVFLATLALAAFSIVFMIGTEIIVFMCRRIQEPIRIPRVYLPRDPFIETASAIHSSLYRTLVFMRGVVVGYDWIAFVLIYFILALVIILGGFVSFGTLCYIVILMLFVAPLLLEKTVALCCNIYAFATWVGELYRLWRETHKEKEA